ncbi:unnamed protein product [Kuraishia capsulata CBS 1993]|uniref:Proteasome assembly chaperone 3 n=1 Tax=Kuraishia capsulata CBS 1993 TaxID=1382522 RepID=W6MRP4_9ASCO|nr:uncharacterized protein KUCA_T00005004001 [Kuraishia capsulata CBS 1993]CDK29018.1 unnamed protein product [Kuraishia capsulata CBS 1993]
MSDNHTQVIDTYENNEISAQIIEFQDKSVIHLALNGEKDTTIDIPLPLTPGIKLASESTSSRISPVVLLGNQQNLKTMVMANQIGTLFYTFSPEPKNLILITSSKLWNEKDDASNADFQKLAFILGLLKRCAGFP